MQTRCLLLYLFLCLPCLVTAQEEGNLPDSSPLNLDIEAFTRSPDDQVLLANAAKDYPVTPGDVYKLTYLSSEGSMSFELIVASDYSINLNLFGVINAENTTYPDLRSRIESIVLKAYPGSRPQLVLQSVGIFQVYITGEVKNSAFVSCWGLSRLANILSGRSTSRSSFRDIEVISAAGQVSRYDIFAFLRSGNKDQNPCLRPDDTVILHPVTRQVKLDGEIHRPGTYQLTGEDNLNRLLTFYGDGLTSSGDPARITILRNDTGNNLPAEFFYLDSTSTDFHDFILRNRDEVYIPGKRDRLAYVYFEGAIQAANQSQIHVHVLVPGERLSTAARNLFQSFTINSDLANSYIIREGEADPIPVDLRGLLYSYQPELDLVLEAGDRIIIPFRQFVVTVSGAVFTPGQYPYVPDKDYQYYINLAGGVDPVKSSRLAVVITDKQENIHPPERIIQPEDRIFAEYNNFLYHVERWSPVIELTLSVTALVFGILQLLSQ